MNRSLQQLSEAGVSIWLDDLSRERLNSGNLAELIKEKSVVGVTTNPTIFAAALAHGQAYDEQIRQLAQAGTEVSQAVSDVMVADVQEACDLFADTYQATSGVDGRVSIEVDPRLANDTDATIAQARELWAAVDRPNCLIKIPATRAGLPAIEAATGDGISVNVTLIFSLERYEEVIKAYLNGLSKAQQLSHQLSDIHSVASFFVSRVDTEVDRRLDELGGDAVELKGRAAIANARLAHRLFRDVFIDQTHALSAHWTELESAGAHAQRPLWASTGVKNKEYSDTRYVVDLVTAGVVNTMPEKTLEAVADHGELRGDTVINAVGDAESAMEQLREAGIDLADVVAVLETEGVEKFVASGEELNATVEAALAAAR